MFKFENLDLKDKEKGFRDVSLISCPFCLIKDPRNISYVTILDMDNIIITTLSNLENHTIWS